MKARRPSLALLALLPALLLAGGCAAVRPCPHKQGNAWREVTSAHFVVHTELGSEDARAVAERLELYRKVMLVAASEAKDPAGKVHVILPLYDGFLTPMSSEPYPEAFSPTLTPWMAFSAQHFGPWSREIPNGTAIGLGQLLTRSTLRRVPRWFAAGWAIYLQSTQLETNAGIAIVGSPLRVLRMYSDASRGGGFMGSVLPLDVLWEMESAGGMHWAAAYEWVYFLRLHHQERLAGLLDAFARGEEPRRAWERSFAGLKDEELHAGVRSFLAPGTSYGEQTFALPDVDTTGLRERPLTDPDVHVLRARLELILPSQRTRAEQRERALGELGVALTRDPEHDWGWLELAQLARDQVAADEARRRAAARPDSAARQLTLAIALLADPTAADERLRSLELAVKLDGGGPLQRMLLARELAERKDWTRAHAESEAAVRLAPWSAHAASLRAWLLAASGRCAEAAPAARRARELLEDAPREAFERLVARVKAYEAGCAAVAPLELTELDL